MVESLKLINGGKRKKRESTPRMADRLGGRTKGGAIQKHPGLPHRWMIERMEKGRDPRNLAGQCLDCGEIKTGFVGVPLDDYGGWRATKGQNLTFGKGKKP